MAAIAALPASLAAGALRCRVQKLIDLALFRSRAFTWGGVLATIATFCMFGLLFVMPQYFGGVLGADAFGTGLRLLPLIGGLLVGARAGRPDPAERAAQGRGGLRAARGRPGAPARRPPSSTGYGFAAAWMATLGAGLGFALPAAMDAALGALAPERSGVGSAVLMAMRQVGGTIGVAVLGTVLAASYRTTGGRPRRVRRRHGRAAAHLRRRRDCSASGSRSRSSSPQSVHGHGAPRPA